MLEVETCGITLHMQQKVKMHDSTFVVYTCKNIVFSIHGSNVNEHSFCINNCGSLEGSKQAKYKYMWLWDSFAKLSQQNAK